MSTRVLEHLAQLVSHDTSDCARTMRAGAPILRYTQGQLELAGFTVETEDIGGGSLNLFAVRGTPSILLNCHLDTVRADPHWQRDPFALTEEGELVYGLGACDIKGAAACMLAMVEEAADDVAILFGTDEEGENGRCVEHFMATHAWKPELVVVAEPTSGKAVLQHRGYASFSMEFIGEAGHTSTPATGSSAAHDAVRWGAAALELAAPGGSLEHARFNIGGVMSGSMGSANVVSSRTVVHFGLRPRPGEDAAEMLEELRRCVPESATVDWTGSYLVPALCPRDEASVERLLERFGIERGPDVDFWTEAALFGEAGLAAIVLGPGDIAQAHQADEFVAVEQLHRAVAAYTRIVSAGVPEVDRVA